MKNSTGYTKNKEKDDQENEVYGYFINRSYRVQYDLRRMDLFQSGARRCEISRRIVKLRYGNQHCFPRVVYGQEIMKKTAGGSPGAPAVFLRFFRA